MPGLHFERVLLLCVANSALCDDDVSKRRAWDVIDYRNWRDTHTKLPVGPAFLCGCHANFRRSPAILDVMNILPVASCRRNGS